MTGLVIDVAQRSPAWYQARCGLLTGSRAAAVFATIKTGEAAARRDLRIQLVVERLTGTPAENGYVSADMQRGIDLEAQACAAYEGATGTVVTPIGFVRHAELEAGCSPDGVIGDDEGILELKVPKSATHLRYLRDREALTAEYRYQVLQALWITGAPYVDLVSFDPRFPEPLQLVSVRVLRTSVDLAAYELAIRVFLRTVDEEYAEVQRLVSAGA